MRLPSLLFIASGLVVSGLFVAPHASAHGDAPSLEAEVGNYLIDIGYEQLAPNTEIEFDIDLFTKNPIDYAEFTSADVRVTRDGAELIAGLVENDNVHIPVFTVTFPEPGGYDLDVRFLNADDSLIVARTFHVDVPDDARVWLRKGFETVHYVLAAGLFALSAGIAIYALWQRFGPKK